MRREGSLKKPDQDADDRFLSVGEEVFAFETQPVHSGSKPDSAPIAASMIAPQAYQISAEVLSQSPQPPRLVRPPTVTKDAKTAAELATMIEGDLSRHPECPQSGFRVTVYGAGHWRAMLTITPAAGRIQEPQKWRNLTEELADRLRQRYDLKW